MLEQVSQIGAVCSTGAVLAIGATQIQYDRIQVPFPYFVTALGAAIAFTWIVAKYQNKSAKKQDELRTEMRSEFAKLRGELTEKEHKIENSHLRDLLQEHNICGDCGKIMRECICDD